MSKPNRRTQRLSKVLWLCNEGWSSPLWLPETPLQWTSGGMPISTQSHLRVQTGHGECIQMSSYILLSEGCDSWICESDLEATSWGPSSSTRQRPRPWPLQNHSHYKYVDDDYEDDYEDYSSHLLMPSLFLLKYIISIPQPYIQHTMSTPTKPFLLYTARTPNGFQVSVLLEELKAINPSIDYEYALKLSPHYCIWHLCTNSVRKIVFSTNEQKVCLSANITKHAFLLMSSGTMVH